MSSSPVDSLQELEALRALVDALLEQLTCPAFVLAAQGEILHRNAAGQRWLATDHGRHGEWLTRAGSDGNDAFRVIRIQPADEGEERRLVLYVGEDGPGQRMHLVAKEWGFSARETEVLELLSEGCSNRAIAERLGLTERTVEAHMTSMIAKAQVESRMQLLARAFRER